MEWLTQNWIWLAFAAVMIFMMRRGGAGGCCGGGGHGVDHKHEAEGGQSTSPGGCCGVGVHGADDKHAKEDGPHAGNTVVGAGHPH